MIVLEAWPAASVDARDDDPVRRLKSARNIVLTTTAELPAHIDQRNIRLSQPSPSLVAALRAGKDHQWLLLHNRSLHADVSTTVQLRESPPHASLLDLRTGQRLAVKYQSAIDVKIPPYGLWALHLTPTQPQVNRVPNFRASQPIPSAWEISKATDDTAETFEHITSRTTLEDWRNWSGLAAYAGTLRYRSTFNLNELRGAIALDAGRVEEVADLFVNGQRLGPRLHPPYRWDITSAVKPGRNELWLDVTNTAFAKWPDSFSHGDAASGLIGPVKILRETP